MDGVAYTFILNFLVRSLSIFGFSCTNKVIRPWGFLGPQSKAKSVWNRPRLIKYNPFIHKLCTYLVWNICQEWIIILLIKLIATILRRITCGKPPWGSYEALGLKISNVVLKVRLDMLMSTLVTLRSFLVRAGTQGFNIIYWIFASLESCQPSHFRNLPHPWYWYSLHW